MELTKELLQEYFTYNDGFLYWKRQTGKGNYIGTKAGTLKHYYSVGFFNKQYSLHRLIFLYHKGYLPENVDHNDRDILNCKIENLRDADKSQNAKNRTSAKNASSKYLGVCFKRQTSRWVVRIRVGYPSKNKNVGYFTTEEMAALAYNREAVRYHGEFANLNIIKAE